MHGGDLVASRVPGWGRGGTGTGSSNDFGAPRGRIQAEVCNQLMNILLDQEDDGQQIHGWMKRWIADR